VSGHLEVITGPMYAGKSEELIRRLRRHEIAGRKILVFSPEIDNRYGEGKIFSHAGRDFDCVSIPVKGEAYDIPDDTNVVAFDEAQFFEYRWLLGSIEDCLDFGFTVIVAGLDMDFRKLPFGGMPQVLAKAKYVVKLRSVCQKCGEDAMYTQRLVNGKPAPLSGETVIVGGAEQYEARCEKCWEAG
jgi:thymidine kinase